MLRFSCDGWASAPVAVADTFFRRWKGLRPRPTGVGLWLPGTVSVHTFGMTEALVAVALDENLGVLEVRLLRPRRVAGSAGAASWLELPEPDPGPPIGVQLTVAPIVG